MATHETRYYFDGHNVARTVKAAACVLAIATFGYAAAELIEHASPLLNAASEFALESQMVSPQAGIKTVDAQAATTATATETVPGAR